MGRPGVGLEEGEGTGARLGPSSLSRSAGVIFRAGTLALVTPSRRSLSANPTPKSRPTETARAGCSKVNGEAGVTNDERTNEHLKLVANWLNTLATGVIAAGVFVPAANEIFNILPSGTDFGLVVGIGAVCFVLGIALHLIGHLFLGGLR